MSTSDEWVSTLDASSGKYYYYNKKTRETTWEQPAGVVIRPRDASSASSQGPPTTAAPTSAPTTAATQPEWKEVVDKSTGKSYYYNRQTKETRWDPPEHFIPAKKDAAPATSATTSGTGAATGAPPTTETKPEDPNDDANWKEAFDAKSGKPYYYNNKTKETRWEDPRSAKAKTQWGIVNPLQQAQQQPTNPLPVSPASQAKRLFAAEDQDQSTSLNIPSNALLHRPSKVVIPPSPSSLPPPASPAPAVPVSVPKEPTPAPAPAPAPVIPRRAESPEPAVSKEEEDAKKTLALKQAVHEAEKKDIKKYLDSDDEKETPEDEDFSFLFAKHRHGWIARTFRVGEVLDQEKIMTFKKSLIKKALLKQNRHLDAECVQAFKNVMSYMGDRKSSKPPMEHATKLLRNVMASPSGLRDEVFLQLCKQTTHNPKEPSTLAGWELMAFALACFPPSKPLKKYLVAYYKDNMEASMERTAATQDKIREFAKYCLECLPKIMQLGQRKEVPSFQELDALKLAKEVQIRVFLLDNTFKTLSVDSYTLASDVLDMMVKKLNLQLAQPFALYEIADQGERAIAPKERILDLVAHWEHVAEEKPEMKAAAAEYKMLFKAKLVLKRDLPQVASDEEAINLFYMQSVNDVITSKYPAKDNHVPILSALQLQAMYGDYHPDMHGHGWLLDKLEQFVPSSRLNENKSSKKGQVQRAEWEQKILSKYEKVHGFKPMEAKQSYLEYVQEYPYYGVTLFSVEQRQFRDFPSPLLLGITCEGALLMHPETRAILDSYRFTDIVTWGHSDEKFILVIGNVVQQRKLVFKTTQGNLMNQLVHDYVKYKMPQN